MKGSESTYSAGIISLKDLCMLICLKEFKSVNSCQRGSCLATNSPHSSGSPTRWRRTRYRRQTVGSDTAPYLGRHRRLGPKTERWSHSLQYRDRSFTSVQKRQPMSCKWWSGASHQPWSQMNNEHKLKKKKLHARQWACILEIHIDWYLHNAVPKNGGIQLESKLERIYNKIKG